MPERLRKRVYHVNDKVYWALRDGDGPFFAHGSADSLPEAETEMAAAIRRYQESERHLAALAEAEWEDV